MAAPPLHVIVVGAGLVGLAAGLALRRAGHHVDIYERSHFAHEVGAAISCSPNATRILLSLRCDPKRFRGVEHLQDQTDEDRPFVTNTDLKSKYGAPYYMCHRVDLHVELKYLATETDGDGRPCVLHLGTGVSALDSEYASITLVDGTVVTGDLVIGADGINSSIRRFVLEEDINPRPCGFSCFRTVIPFDEVARHPSLSWVTTNPKAMGLVWHERRALVLYPCRDGTLLNFAGNHPDRRTNEEVQLNINAPSSKEDFLDTFSDYAPRYKELINLSRDVTLWPFLIWDSLPTWVNQRSCLIGDAAHAMFPMLGQGGAQGFEDIVTLGILFPLGTSKDSGTIASRLKLFESLRKPRASEIQDMSNRIGKGLPILRIDDELEKQLYGYNAADVARKALAAELTDIKALLRD
ncbi:FAD/NAD(P)-binding domain-containing protein [Sistotremastrum suecicum HHB10207 ss-3]|uniref:FAD/NAD(P)-binding domain-containing protein n=1 Tax=Sistotremastrum suecicum HHB10207 ss-3 TaxID=1314776 RepID=A0A166ACB2_9AGAM|nr:FAD/NAD(P)-binding domain-containing protein [Sistotremastrum suecicum HHB10207 ss-3]